MPRRQINPEDHRERVVEHHQRVISSATACCARYGVRRRTRYMWRARYDAGAHPTSLARSHAS